MSLRRGSDPRGRRLLCPPEQAHFGAAEEPERLARDIAAFFAERG